MFCFLIKCSRYRHLYEGSSVDVLVNQSADHLRKFMSSRKVAAKDESTHHPRLAPADALQVESSPPISTNEDDAEDADADYVAIPKHERGVYDFEYNNVSKYCAGAGAGAVAGHTHQYEYSSNGAVASDSAAIDAKEVAHTSLDNVRIDCRDVDQGPQVDDPQGVTGSPDDVVNANPEVHSTPHGECQKSIPTQVAVPHARAGRHTHNQSLELSTMTPFTERRRGVDVSHSDCDSDSDLDCDARERGHYMMHSVDWDMPSMRNVLEVVSTKEDIANSEK